MAREQIPITPALVTWARVRAGYTPENAANRFAKIAEWEAGDSAPTYPQLEAMADTFKVPIAVFFFPEPPDVPSIDESFRTLPEFELDQLPPKIRLLLRKAKTFQIALSELNNGRNPADRLITRDLVFPATISPSAMTDAVRNYLGVTVENQAQWADTDVALKGWRRCLLEVGIYVFKDQFRNDDFAGFCLTDENFPIIYVNNTNSPARQIFTIFHELAHLLFKTSGIDIESDGYIDELSGDAKRIEVLCNQFAGIFLVPPTDFTAALRATSGEITQQIVARLAEQFKVSQLVIYRRLLDTNRIDQTAYDAAQSRAMAKGRSRPRGSGDYYNTKLAYLGRPFVALALSQYHQERISAEQLADYLDIKPRNLVTLEERFLRGART